MIVAVISVFIVKTLRHRGIATVLLFVLADPFFVYRFSASVEDEEMRLRRLHDSKSASELRAFRWMFLSPTTNGCQHSFGGRWSTKMTWIFMSCLHVEA